MSARRSLRHALLLDERRSGGSNYSRPRDSGLFAHASPEQQSQMGTPSWGNCASVGQARRLDATERITINRVQLNLTRREPATWKVRWQHRQTKKKNWPPMIRPPFQFRSYHLSILIRGRRGLALLSTAALLASSEVAGRSDFFKELTASPDNPNGAQASTAPHPAELGSRVTVDVLTQVDDENRHPSVRQAEAAQSAPIADQEPAVERARAEALDRELSKWRKESQKLRDETRVLGVQLHNAQREANVAEQVLARERARANDLDSSLRAARSETRMLTARQDDARQKVSAAAEQLGQERARSEGLERDLAAARQDVKNLRDAQGGGMQQASQAAAELAEARERSQGLDRELAAAREEIRKLTNAQGSAAREASALAAELAQNRKHSRGLERDLASARGEVKTLRDANGGAARETSNVVAELVQEREHSQGLSRELASSRE